MDNFNKKRSAGIDLILPFLVWVMIIIVFLNVKNIPVNLTEKNHLVFRYFVKFVMTILFPLGLIYFLNKNKGDFGIYFPKFSDSFKLSFRAYAVGGPAGISFWIIAAFGWGFADWPGSLILSIAYLIVFYFVPRVTKKMPTRDGIDVPNRRIIIFVVLSMVTIIFAYVTYEHAPIVSKILYYIFIVGLGEELLFRGYFQSSFNRFFGKAFKIGNVKFGWGLFLSAALFGLMHALVVAPPIWPWSLFTFMIGLTLGFVREKDGSILAAVLLHAMLDMPLVFIN